MSKQTTHPSPNELHAYGLGHLTPDEATAIERHLSACEPCCETIADLSSADTFIAMLQSGEQEPNSQTVDQTSHSTGQNSSNVPQPLAEHPRYEIIRLIGKGGMGDVYEARHRKMNRTVALKVIKRELVRNRDAVDRFQREVTTAAQLSHPNIVTAHDADNAGDYHFMVMEHVDGVDLSRIIKDRGTLPVPEASEYIRQAAIGLQCAHQQGMVHRDIKPHNLMLTTEGTVKILDFGLATLAPDALKNAEPVEARGDLTAAGAIMGTPDFISPEQANDARKADIRSDIYSLGTTLYFLLSGRPPFDQGSIMQKLKNHAQADARPLESLREDVPADLAAVVSKMMAKNPSDRFQTPIEVADALAAYSPAAEPERTPTLQSAVQSARSPSRFLLLTAVATLFLAALAAGVLFYLQTGHGTIRVTLMDESLEATIDGQKIEVKDGDKEFEINAGPQQLVIRQKGSDTEFASDSFRIWRNKTIRFKVELLAGTVVLTKDGEPFGDQKLGPMPPAMATVPKPGSGEPIADGLLEARNAYVRAKQFEKSGDFVSAADAYLEAYRGDPSLLEYDQFATIQKAKRTREFVEVFTVDRLKQVPFAKQPASAIVRDLLTDDATCLDGNVFLKNMWKAKPEEARLLVGYRADEVWPNVTDTTFLIRDRVLPADIPAEGPGWSRFTIDSIGARGGTGAGVPQNLRPLFKNTPQQKDALQKLAREVESKTKQFPSWKAGVAILGFLEAEVGNEKRAVKLFEKALTDAADPLPAKSAWVFGLALEGKSVALDQIVMRLYERNLTESYSENTALNVSSIASLARLYAKYDRRDEARQLLLRLSAPQGPGTNDKDSQFVSCSDGFVLYRETEAGWIVLPEDAVPQSNCIACHRKERNLENYLLMANGLTDIGYPVDARLALGRIGASFYNALGSDEAWARSNTSILRWSYFGKEAFQPARAKAERAVTPQALLEALKSGVVIDSDMKNPVIEEQASRIELMLGVRGENGKSTLFSPVIDMLELAAKAKGDEARIANGQIDQLLAEAFEENPQDLEVGIAATAFACLRSDHKAANRRLQKLRKRWPNEEDQRDTVGLWLVARLALTREATREIGEELADRAISAAENQSSRLLKEAIIQETKDFAMDSTDRRGQTESQ